MAADDVMSCTNQFCPGKGQTFSATTGFDLLVDLTDHTGTLHGCTLRSPEAEKMLGCTVSNITRVLKKGSFTVKVVFCFQFF